MWKGAKQAEVLVDMPRIPLQSWQLVQAAKRVLTKSMGHNGTYQWTKVRDSLSLWLTFSFVVREPVSWCAILQAVRRCSAFSRSNKLDNSPVLPTGGLYLSKEDYSAVPHLESVGRCWVRWLESKLCAFCPYNCSMAIQAPAVMVAI